MWELITKAAQDGDQTEIHSIASAIEVDQINLGPIDSLFMMPLTPIYPDVPIFQSDRWHK